MSEPAATPAPSPTTRKRFAWGRLVAWILLLTFITLQFFQADKNNNTISLEQDLTAVVPVPDAVQTSLQAACYDCHSNNTNYPWYTNIQPVGWWLRKHINNGKSGLNFNAFATYTPAQQQEKLGGIASSLRDGWMPLDSYTWLHKEARLNARQQQEIIRWAEAARQQIGTSHKPTH